MPAPEFIRCQTWTGTRDHYANPHSLTTLCGKVLIQTATSQWWPTICKTCERIVAKRRESDSETIEAAND